MLLPLVAAIASGMYVAEAPLTHHSNRLLSSREPLDVWQTDDLANHADPLGLIEILLHRSLTRLVLIVTSIINAVKHPACNLP